ncbi:hypothetical protein [Aureimonas sp. SA4125]|uniref:hypothetical protein n=1 Tax=Aureimonas sp. SA4125 TaxID=2826993 RepID=UPI001CC42A75|nr:hypothetical protein [Aureimonas sp. SA4125]
MKQLRLIMADRSTGGVLASFVAVMALVQLFLGGIALGATALPGTQVICSAGGDHGPRHAPGQDQTAADCALACQAGRSLAAPPPQTDPGEILPVRLSVAAERPPFVVTRSSRGDVGLHKNAQAPPLPL